MKTIHAIKIVSGALVVLASLNAYAQASDMTATSATVAAPNAKQQAKAIKTADRALQKKVRAAIAKSNGISVANIMVRARSGAVTLEGTVPEQTQSDKAAEVAQRVEGVMSVKNALKILPEAY